MHIVFTPSPAKLLLKIDFAPLSIHHFSSSLGDILISPSFLIKAKKKQKKKRGALKTVVQIYFIMMLMAEAARSRCICRKLVES